MSGISTAKKVIEDITNHLLEHDEVIYEGSASPEQFSYIASLVSKFDLIRVAEVGFNAGISSFAFLCANPRVQVTSFDLGRYTYVDAAKKYIDAHFPGRHELIIGDSGQTIPKFADKNPQAKFDLIFIDGGHTYEVAKSDIVHLRTLSHIETKIIIDDLMPWVKWGAGPAKAWNEALGESVVVQEELLQDGVTVEKAVKPAQRVWALGRYVYL